MFGEGRKNDWILGRPTVGLAPPQTSSHTSTVFFTFMPHIFYQCVGNSFLLIYCNFTWL